MNVKYILDSSCDIDPKMLEDPSIADFFHIEPLTYTYSGRNIPDDFGKTVPIKEFYNSIRSGQVCKTSQVNIQSFLNVFEKYTNEGKSIVYLGFSSGISGTVNNSLSARDMFLETHPDADITIIDTLCVSGGYAMLVWQVIDMIKEGKSKEEIVDWVLDNRLNMNHLFTVDDLLYLKRGGRVSAVSAAVGTMFDIKPVMYVDKHGKLIPYKKVKGRKKSLVQLMETFSERVFDIKNQQMLISHGDCKEDAMKLGEMIERKFGTKPFRYTVVGATVGAHSGPGTVALFFFGKDRNKYSLV